MGYDVGGDVSDVNVGTKAGDIVDVCAGVNVRDVNVTKAGDIVDGHAGGDEVEGRNDNIVDYNISGIMKEDFVSEDVDDMFKEEALEDSRITADVVSDVLGKCNGLSEDLKEDSTIIDGVGRDKENIVQPDAVCKKQNKDGFFVGLKIHSEQELEKAIKNYEQSNFCSLWKKDVRTLAAARKKTPRKAASAKPSLKYYTVLLKCLFSDEPRKSCNERTRNTKSFRQGCPFEIFIKLSADGQALEVTRMNEVHNHELVKDIFDHLPKQRCLSKPDRLETEEAIKLKANSKLLQEKLQRTTGKKVTLKDIANLKQNTRKDVQGNDLDEVVSLLNKQDGTSVEVIVDDEQNFKGLLYMDSYMKNMYSKFPELLLVDATHKLLQLRMPVYLLLCVDGNGLSEIVCLFYVVEETKELIEAAVNAFKKFCPSWKNTSVVMSDKDFTERNVFTSCFPQAKLNICLYHTLRSLQREITCTKMGITSAERIRCLEILSKMAYSRTPGEYAKHHTELDTVSRSVRIYIDINWVPIKEQWVSCFKDDTLNLGETTNNRLESTFSKIKSVCSKYATILQFTHEFLSVLSVLRNERSHNYVMSIVRKPIKKITNQDLQKYCEFLTPYAFKYVEEQFNHSSKLHPVSETIDNTFTFSALGGSVNKGDNVVTTTYSCNCPFRNRMALPCKHMFKVRRLLELSLFDPAIVRERWTMENYKTLKETRWSSNSKMPIDNYTLNEVTVPSNGNKVTLTQAQKFRKGMQMGHQLASLLSEGGMKTFHEREKVLKMIIEKWKLGEAIGINGDQRDTDAIYKQERSEECIVSPMKCPLDAKNEFHEDTSELPKDRKEKEKTNLVDKNKLNYKMPPPMVKRGRPKGAELTVIGIPKKKQKLHCNKILPFCKLQPKEKDRIILECITNPLSAAVGLSGKRILNKSDLNYNIHDIPDMIKDRENVDINRIAKYFDKKAWLDILGILHKKEQQKYSCSVCSSEISDESQESIACERCLSWFHFSCTSIKSAPKKRNWFCSGCKIKYLG